MSHLVDGANFKQLDDGLVDLKANQDGDAVINSFLDHFYDGVTAECH